VLNFLASAHRQICILGEPVDTFTIYPRKLLELEITDASLAEPAAYMRDLNNTIDQITHELIGLGRVKETDSA
jgi:hypothetical protein